MKKIVYVCAIALSLIAFNACNKGELKVSPVSSSGDNDINALSKKFNPDKGDICHNGNTVNINKNSLAAHLGHGDIPGSCGNPLPANSWYAKVGLGTITEAKNNSAITNTFFSSASDQIRVEFEDYLSDEYLFNNKKTAFAFTSKINPARTLLIASKGGAIESRIVTLTSTDIITSDIDGIESVSVPLGPSPVFAPDCDELGPPRSGEGFGECFVRNVSNFCCDFIGCVAILGATLEVGLAIEAVCIFGG